MAQDVPKKQELSGAEHRLKEFEKKVERYKGKSFKLGFQEQETLKLILKLKEKYPTHPQVQDLSQRLNRAIMASKGEMMEVSASVVSFRDNSKKLIQSFWNIGKEEWEKAKFQIMSQDTTIVNPFPIYSPEETDVEDYQGRWVILEGIEYPRNEFKENGVQWLYVGKPNTGYYWIHLSGREWQGAYGALKRYMRHVSGDIPQEISWTVAGKITGCSMLIPEAGEQKIGSAYMGWTVEPEYILIPNYSLVRFVKEHKEGGIFSGEEKMEEIKQFMYSIREVPADIEPKKLAEIYITAIKERNYKLWLDCIDPERLKTPTAVSLANYHWERHLKVWNSLYVEAKVQDKIQIDVVQGEYLSPEERKILTQEQIDKILKHSKPLIQQATVMMVLFENEGKQNRLPQKFYLRRYQEGRWYVEVPWLPH